MKLGAFIVIQLAAGLHAVEYEFAPNEVVDVEVVFPKQSNLNTETSAVKTNAFVTFLDRLLNRNQGSLGSSSSSSSSVSNSNNGIQATTPRRTSVLGSLVFVPDVSKGVDTILTGVATGNLERIISGSFIFAPPPVQNVANNVINRVFGGPSIGTLGNNGGSGNRSNTTTNQGGASSSSQAASASGWNPWATAQQQPEVTTQAPDIDIRVQGVNNTSTTAGGFFSSIFGGLYSKSGAQRLPDGVPQGVPAEKQRKA